MPIISVVTPCYNGARHLDALFESMRMQTLTEWEHIVVDDGSGDESAAIVEQRSANDPRVKLVRQPNGGVARARNAGYRAASPDSRYVYFLDADDLLESEMLQTMVEYLDGHPSVGLAYCDVSCIDGDGAALANVSAPRYEKTRFGVRLVGAGEPRTSLLSIYCWAPVMESVSVMRRSVYALTAGWDETIGQPGEGVDLFVQIAFHSEVHFIGRRLYRYRRHAAQASAELDRLMRQDLRVQVKWRDRRDIPARFRALIDEAQAFRAGRLRLYLSASAGLGYLRRAQLRHAARCFLDGLQTATRIARRESPWPTQVAL